MLTADARDCHIQFRTAAENFQLIDEDGSVSIIIPYDNPDKPERDSRPRIAQLRSGELHRGLLRELQRFTVTVRRHDFQRLEKAGELEEIVQGIWVLRNETAYHPDLGLLLEETGSRDPGGLYC
jgi:CRISPR-associated endonuclease/helicase Cas3